MLETMCFQLVRAIDGSRQVRASRFATIGIGLDMDRAVRIFLPDSPELIQLPSTIGVTHGEP